MKKKLLPATYYTATGYLEWYLFYGGTSDKQGMKREPIRLCLDGGVKFLKAQ
jgi:hypothetical protein